MLDHKLANSYYAQKSGLLVLLSNTIPIDFGEVCFGVWINLCIFSDLLIYSLLDISFLTGITSLSKNIFKET